MENRENTEWKVIRDEEDDEELVYADWIVVDQSGELVANVHGRTVGDCITNADLIADAPRLRRINRDMDFAIRRLIKVFTPSPTAGIVDDAERKAAIFQQSVERSDAVDAARSLISWMKTSSLFCDCDMPVMLSGTPYYCHGCQKPLKRAPREKTHPPQIS